MGRFESRGGVVACGASETKEARAYVLATVTLSRRWQER